MTAVEFLKEATQCRKEQKRKSAALRRMLEDLAATAKTQAEHVQVAREAVIDELVDDDGEYDERDEDVLFTIENMSFVDEDGLAGMREMLDDWDQQGKNTDDELLKLADAITERKRAR